jgi:NAD(P)-dependent dehydrogenase (short-subunit alcohol dehydrogenase family)
MTDTITGGASGFGAAMSERFAQEGCKILIGDLNEAGAQKVADKVGDGSNVKVVKMNVCEEAAWKAAVDKCVQEFGQLDILVNNAGWTYKNKVGI